MKYELLGVIRGRKVGSWYALFVQRNNKTLYFVFDVTFHQLSSMQIPIETYTHKKCRSDKFYIMEHKI